MGIGCGAFLKDYQQVLAMVQEHGASTKVALILKQMLGDWLTNHICRVDAGLRNCPANPNAAGVSRRGELPLAGDF